MLHWKFGNQYIDRNIEGVDLPKVVRWYVANDRVNSISATNSNNGNAYTPAFGRNVVMIDKLSDYDILPDNIDYQFYISQAYSLYKDLTGDNITGNTEALDMLREVITRLKLTDLEFGGVNIDEI